MLHNGPGAPVVRQRWFFTEQPFLPIDSQCVFLNRIWDSDDVADVTVGALPLVEAHYVQDARWVIPPDLPGNHMCRPEWFAVGEPWPNTLPRTVRDRDGAPLCCRPPMPLEFQNGTLDPVNGQPASQLQQYAIPFADVVATTPFQQLTVGDALGGTGPNIRGFTFTYHPLGTTAAPNYTFGMFASNTGQSEFVRETFIGAGGGIFTREIKQSGFEWKMDFAGNVGTLGFSVLFGQFLLGGTNVKIVPTLLPNGTMFYSSATVTAQGTDQATAADITVQNVGIATGSLANSGLRLPSGTSGPTLVTVTQGTSALTRFIYPSSGQRIAGAGGTNLPVSITTNTAIVFLRTGSTSWVVLYNGTNL